jgi:hypothetical protein
LSGEDATASCEVETEQAQQEEQAVPGVGEALRTFMEVRIFGCQSVVPVLMGIFDNSRNRILKTSTQRDRQWQLWLNFSLYSDSMYLFFRSLEIKERTHLSCLRG